MDRSKDAENVLQQFGGFGRWQISIYILHAATFGSFGWIISAAVYLVDTPPYHCKVPENSTFNATIPAKWEDGKITWFDSCHEYVNESQGNLTQPCSNGYWFDPDYGYISTITTDFELVCDKAILIEHTMVATSVINLIFSLGVSYMIDRVGRKIPLVVGALVRPIFGMAESFMPNFYIKTAVSIVGGVLQLGLMSGSFLLALELFPSDTRTLPGTIMEMAWGVGMVLCTPFIYFFRDWRWLVRAMYIPTFLLYLVVLTPESITWLVRKGKYKQVKKVALQAAKVNKKPAPGELLNLLDERIAETSDKKPEGGEEKIRPADYKTQAQFEAPQFTYRDLLRFPTIRKYLLIQIFIWFVNAFVYFALNLTMTYMPGDRYVNFAFFALAELVAAVLHVLLLMKFGRRIPMFFFHLLAGVGLMLTVIEVFKDHLHFNWVPMVMAFNVIGRLGITASFMTIYLFTSEIFPTSVRALALGVCSFFSGFSMLITPYTRVLERHQPGLLRGICGVLAILAGLLGLLLPETHNRPLPETVEDVEGKKYNKPKDKTELSVGDGEIWQSTDL